jgi:hypothetical protein
VDEKIHITKWYKETLLQPGKGVYLEVDMNTIEANVDDWLTVLHRSTVYNLD